MAALTQKQKNEMWSQERKNLMARVDRLRAAGVTISIHIERPKKITVAHIATLKSVTRNRLLKGVNNKVLKVDSIIPENVNRDSQGRIYATSEQKEHWKFINRQAREREALAKSRAAEVADLPEIDFTNSDYIDEDYSYEPTTKVNEPTQLHDIYTLDTILKLKELNEEYGDFYSEIVDMLSRSKSGREMLTPEMREYALKMSRDKEKVVEQIEEEKEFYQKYHSQSTDEQGNEETEVAGTSTYYIDYENGKKYNIDSDGVITDEPIHIGQQPVAYYRDVNTGTVYDSDDSRIYQRNSQGRLKYDTNGNPLIKPTLARIDEQVMSREEYEALVLELIRSKYENLATDVGSIVLSRMDEWQKKYSADEIRAAKEAAAADGYDITWADMYDGDEERLALQLDVIESYLPFNDFTQRLNAIQALAQYDDENDNYEEPD